MPALLDHEPWAFPAGAAMQLYLSVADHKPPQNLGASRNNHFITHNSVSQNLGGSGGTLISAPCCVGWSGPPGARGSKVSPLTCLGSCCLLSAGGLSSPPHSLPPTGQPGLFTWQLGSKSKSETCKST